MERLLFFLADDKTEHRILTFSFGDSTIKAQ